MTKKNSSIVVWVVLLALVFCSAEAGAQRGGLEDHIFSPSASNPVKATSTFDAVVRLRLPLTPPPGVQQPRARKGWSASLTRADLFSADDRPPKIEYPAFVIRIRPIKENTYKIPIRVLPWMPPGVYDLSIDGPGFSSTVSQAVVIGNVDTSEKVSIDRRSSSLNVINNSAQKVKWIFELIIPSDVAGMVVKTNNRAITPSLATWAEMPSKDNSVRRVLRFQFLLEPGITSIQWSPNNDAAICDVGIIWEREGRVIEPMSWQELSVRTDDKPVTVLWKLGEEHWASGKNVRHRWIRDIHATAAVTTFDGLGRTCRAAAEASVKLESRQGACGCRLIGGATSSGESSLINLMFFLFLFNTEE